MITQYAAPELNVRAMTASALGRFSAAVDSVMRAHGLDPVERVQLISHWAYQYTRPDMPEQLARAIGRCQGEPDALRINASSAVCAVTGEVVAFSGD